MKTSSRQKESGLCEGIASHDLHNHTYWSFDASVPVEAYFRRAVELGVRCFAITEHHHNLSAGDIAAAAGDYPDIKVLRAAEITASTSLGPVDLLCYGLPETAGPKLTELLATGAANSAETGERISRLYQQLGVPFDGKRRREALLIYKPGRVMDHGGATHVRGNYLLQYFLLQGWVNSHAEFKSLQQEVNAKLQRPEWPSAARVGEAIRESGGLIVIAHPYANFDGADRQRMDRLREECQLDGIECAHYRIPQDLNPVYRDYCKQHGLVSTAGSDSHSYADIDSRFGRHGGEEIWFEEFMERLYSIQPACCY